MPAKTGTLPSPEPRLEELPLFCGLSAAETERIRRGLQRRSVPAGHRLLVADDDGRVAFLILRGLVKVVVGTASGAEVFLALLGPGDMVGELSAVDGKPRSATVVAMHETVVAVAPGNLLAEAMQTMPRFSHNVASVLAGRLRQANNRIEALATATIEERVAMALVELAERFGRPTGDGSIAIPFRLSQTDLGGMAGASRVRTNQTLGALRKAEIISVENQWITVHNLEALETTGVMR